MKTLIISLLFILTANAQNVWYVDRDSPAGNNGDGRSWNTAWRTLDSSVWLGYNGVNWAIIGDGDTIYVSGGTDSTRYYPITNNYYNGIRREPYEVQRTFNQTVVIAPAWHPGHDGDVYFTQKNNSTYSIFIIAGVDNVKITGFNFVDTKTNEGTNFNGIMALYGSDNTLENCFIYNRGLTTGIYLEGARLTLRNNLFDYEENDFDKDIDPIGLSGGSGNHIIEGNIIITRNNAPTTTSHRDAIQYGGLVTPFTRVENIIRNNLILNLGNSDGWNALIYTSGVFADTTVWYIYNNVFVSKTIRSSVGGIFAYQYPQPQGKTYNDKYFILNNTMIINSPPNGLSMPINIGSDFTDSVMIHNNLILTDAPVNLFLALRPFTRGVPPYDSVYYFRKVNNNGYFEFGGLSGAFYSGERFGAWTFQRWQQGGWDLNSITGNSTTVTFNNKYGEAFQDYYTETGRGMGLNLATEYPWLVEKLPDLMFDALGTPRGNTWDIGALQFQGSPSINVQGKIFLQGPFSSNSMSTNLVQNGFLPTSQPYNSAPWNYSGNEVLGSGASSAFVDWVLVELRSSSNPAQVIGRRAAILRNDGRLVETDGTLGVRFNNMNDGTYYVAVFHRNHLAIMSANPVQLSNNSQLYDFTNAMNKAYGTNPMASLPGGVFGMLSGDGNSDDGVTITDRNDVWQLQNGTMGYLKGDFNLDGGVNIIDANGFWSPNNGRQSQVP